MLDVLYMEGGQEFQRMPVAKERIGGPAAKGLNNIWGNAREQKFGCPSDTKRMARGGGYAV